MIRRSRRWLLGAAAIFGVAGPWLVSCSADFDPPSRIEGMRVLAVAPDKSYAAPGDTVHFKMTWDAGGDFAGVTPQILWLGGCFNPDDDQYYGCFTQFADIFSQLQSGDLPENILLGRGLDEFDLHLPANLIRDHAPPATGSNFGLAYLFFAVCAGELRPVPAGDAGGLAGNFPIGCFGSNGERVGAEGFVPGFTQIYAFADGRTNENPNAKSILIKRPLEPVAAYQPLSDDATKAYDTVSCSIDEDSRRKLGCGNTPFTTCAPYDIDVDVSGSVSEVDPGSPDNGKFLHEAVWVDWYTDGGDFDADVSLLYDPRAGLVASPDRSIQWIAPPDKGTYSIWGVVHDARGGTTVLRGYVNSN